MTRPQLVFMYCRRTLSLQPIAAGIDAQEDEEQDGEAPQRGASVAEEGQGNADDGRQTQHHTHIDEDMEEEHRQDTIAIHTPERIGLSFSQMDEA